MELEELAGKTRRKHISIEKCQLSGGTEIRKLKMTNGIWNTEIQYGINICLLLWTTTVKQLINTPALTAVVSQFSNLKPE